MVTLANSTVPSFVSFSPRSCPTSLSPERTVSLKKEDRMHKRGTPSVASVTFIGESYWRSRAPALVSLEAASQTPSIIKRGFEYTYHKSHGYRLTGGSLYFGPAPNAVRKSQRDLLNIDSAKKVLKVAPLISLEEAQRRELSRRNRADTRAMEKEVRIEREVSCLKREVAEIAWKKAQAKHEEESIVRLERELGQDKMFEVVGKQKEGEGPMLTAAVAAREDGLVVAPTNWIVPLISLDEARHSEKAKRNAADTKSRAPLPLSPFSAVSSVNLLTVNAGNGNTTKVQLVSLEEARGRDRTRRLEEDAVSRTRMLAKAGTGLNHVSLITLAEARNQDALRRNRSSRDGDRSKSSGYIYRSRMPSHHSPPSPVNWGSTKDASAPQEKARWFALMSGAENLWTGPNVIPAYRLYTTGYP